LSNRIVGVELPAEQSPNMKTALVYLGAAIAEIGGCFAFWGWLRLAKPMWWLLPGVLSLVAFAYLLTLVRRAGPMPLTAVSISSPRCFGCGALKTCGRMVGIPRAQRSA
jgi:hypothetical protein